ncbi:MAG: hypothetical protein E6R05_05375 [Candidatus Moraniibacteriota bacterium]|nr:MAG: hypothetical protein E6R05_05375 [Candidatus Moranbacteria bacterium]
MKYRITIFILFCLMSFASATMHPLSHANNDAFLNLPSMLVTTNTPSTYTPTETPTLILHTSRTLLQQLTTFLASLGTHPTPPILKIISPNNEILYSAPIIANSPISFNSAWFSPGVFQIFVEEKKLTEFGWGVLALNTAQSVYHTGDSVQFDLAALDHLGNMVCDAELNLRITDPDNQQTILSTQLNSIKRNPACLSKDITLEPDYSANIIVTKIGTYHLNLTASINQYYFAIEDKIVVDDSQPVYLKRVATTRIYPQNVYPVEIVLTANRDIQGQLKDYVPHGFALSQLPQTSNFSITNDEFNQIITWDLALQAGQSKSFSYAYDAPDSSPELYLFGPAKVLDSNNNLLFQEQRRWQIAIDAIAHEQTVTGSSDSSSTVASSTITGTTDHLYLAAISEKDNQTVSGVSGLGLTWALILAQCGARAQTRTEVWYAIGTPSGDDAVTATFSVAPTEATIAVSRYSGINTSSPIGASTSKNSNGVSGACSGGTDASSYTVDLTTTTANSHAYGAVSLRARTHTAGSGYTERGEVSSPNTPAGSGSGVAVEDKLVASASTVAVDGTLSGVNDYAVVALEIKPFSNSAPSTPTLDSPTDTATNQSLTPALLTTATDSNSDYLRYKIELCTNVGMTTGCQTFDQTSSQTGWSGQNTQTSTAYTSGTQATYTIQSALSASTTYYWRSYAIDPGGTNTWSSTQTPKSFTTTTAPSSPTTPYTEGATNPTGITDLTPEFSAIHNDANADAATYYQINVNTASDFTGTSMWDSGTVSMTSTADTVRSPDISYAGTSLSYGGTTYYWRIRFTDTKGAVGAWSTTASFATNSTPSTPTLDSPTDTATNQSTTTTLATTTTDTNSDYLRYKIELCTNVGMTTGCQTFDQTSSQTGWSGQDTQTSTAYTSGTQASYTLQSALSNSTTYYWRSYAIDPAGTNTWSSTQTPKSFTTIAGGGGSATIYLNGVNLGGVTLN